MFIRPAGMYPGIQLKPDSDSLTAFGRPQCGWTGDTQSVTTELSSRVSCAPGVTGARSSMESRVEQLVSSLHAVTDKAVCVGFGVSGPSQVGIVTQPG